MCYMNEFIFYPIRKKDHWRLFQAWEDQPGVKTTMEINKGNDTGSQSEQEAALQSREAVTGREWVSNGQGAGH